MLRLLMVLAIVGCGKRTIDKTDAPTCSTMAECNELAGQRVEIIGVYSVYDPLSSRTKDMPPPRQVEVRLAGEDGPLLGESGSDDVLRPLDEIARLKGKRVHVTGTFLVTPPSDPDYDPKGGLLIYPRIHPIERIEVE